MPLVKAHYAAQTHRSAIAMDLADIEQEASQIIASAHAEAARILAEAHSNAAREGLQIRANAKSEGYAEGLAQGAADGQKSGHEQALATHSQVLKDLTTRWSQTLDILHQHMPAHVADAKTDLVRLALTIAAKITHQEALQNRNVAQATIEDTLQMIGATRTVTLLASPDEIESLQKYLPELTAKFPTIPSISLTPDPSITPGGCRAQFGTGQIDATIETQHQRIADELLAGE